MVSLELPWPHGEHAVSLSAADGQLTVLYHLGGE